MGWSDHLLTTLLLLSLISAGDSAPPPLSAAGGCSDQVVSFSPCLQFISLPPNNRSSEPSSGCCSALSHVSTACLCHLVRKPLLLGFPLSTSRILSLSSLCSRPLPSANTTSLESFCSGSSALPPLQPIIGPGIPARPRFHDQHPRLDFPQPQPSTSTSSPEVTDSDALPSEVNLTIITPNSSSFQPTHVRSGAEKIRNRSIVSFGLVISILVPIFSLHMDTPLYHLCANQVGYQLSRIKQSGNK